MRYIREGMEVWRLAIRLATVLALARGSFLPRGLDHSWSMVPEVKMVVPRYSEKVEGGMRFQG